MKVIKKILKLIFTMILIVVVSTIAYVYFFSPNAYQFHSIDYIQKNLPNELDGMKIVYFSDANIHDEEDIERFEEIVNELNDKTFDVILFGGDLYDNSVIESKRISNILKSINCKYGKFAVLGDKDELSSLEVTQVLNDGGFEVLSNDHRTLYYKNTPFELTATDMDSDISTYKYKDDTLQLCLSHYPDSFISTNKYIDLQLSGHSYGGSIYLPYLGSLKKDEYSDVYNHGTYTKDGATLVVTNGLRGPNSFPYKLLTKNEICIITLSK